MQQLILGTAQLGMNYGINNLRGKPSKDEIYNILDIAFDNNINILDTAAAYGDSEQIIGNYMQEKGNKFKVVTKLSKLEKNVELSKQINMELNKSLENLKVDTIDYYLLHNFKDVIDSPEILDRLNTFKKDGKINEIGISIYETEELNYIIENLSNNIDIIQIPFNIFDLRWLESDMLKKANEKGIQISSRSVFLQGLFFLDEIRASKIYKNCYHYISILNNLCTKKKVDIKTVALDFVKSQSYIDYILVGCDTSTQLIENISTFNRHVNLNKKEIEYIMDNFKDINTIIIDPRKWNK